MATIAQVKLTDGGANTLSFVVDSYRRYDIEFASRKRATDGTLKSYYITTKKGFELSVKNMSSTDKATLKTIYDLHTTLEFYEAYGGAKTADVEWQGNFDLHTPTEESYQLGLVGGLFQGTIVLEEI